MKKKILSLMMATVVTLATIGMAGCQYLPDAVIDALHKHTLEKVEAKEATCTEEGNSIYYYCKDKGCGKYFSDAKAETEINKESVVIPATGHTEVVVPGNAATCTAPGLTDGKKCSVCGETLIAQETIPATGHTEVVVPGNAATCTAPGLTDGKKCSVCGETLVAQEEIPVKDHTEVVVPGNAATCTASGLTDGKKCSVCGETLVAQEPISAKGHKDEAPHDYVCDVCEEELCLNHVEVEDAAVEATCTETGLTAGKHCSICGEITKAQEVVPVKGHTEETVAGKDATCAETGLTEGKKCSVCGETLVAQEEIPVKDHAEETVAGKDATCTETGLTEGKKCSVCGETLVAQEEIAVKDHTEETVAGKDATCTETGLTEGKKCSVCGETLVAQEEIPATGHDYSDWTVVTAATKESTGFASKECAICGDVVEKELPVLNEVDYTVEKDGVNKIWKYEVEKDKYVTITTPIPLCACVKCDKCISGCEGHEQCDCPFDVVLSATETVKSEAETWSMEGVITREDHLAIGTPAGTYKTEFGNGQTCIFAIGNGTVFTLKLNVVDAGNYNIAMIGSQGAGAETLKFTIDGVEIAASGSYATAPGQYHDWQQVTLETTYLTEGVHIFVLTFVSSNGNIDGVTFTPVPTCGCVKCGKCISGCEGHEQCDCPFDAVLSATETVKSEAETWSMEGVVTREDHLAIGTPAGTYKTEFGNGQTCIYAIGNGTVFTLKLSVPVEGDWNIVMIGTQGGPASNLKFTMDGVEIAASGDYSTGWGEWHDWREITLDTVHLTAGNHVFVINFVNSNGNIDGVTFTPVPSCECVKCGKCISGCEGHEQCDCPFDAVLSATEVAKSEAETWSMEGVITRADHLAVGTPAGTYKTEFGNGQTCIFAIGDGTVFTLKLNVVDAGNYNIAMIGSQGAGAETLKFTIDGVEIAASGSYATAPGQYHDWQQVTLETTYLTEGVHIFVLTFVSSNGNIDGITFAPVAA